jgi:hypothetical protein
MPTLRSSARQSAKDSSAVPPNQAAHLDEKAVTAATIQPVLVTFDHQSELPTQSRIQSLPSQLTRGTTRLGRADHTLLLGKQAELREISPIVPRDFERHAASTVGATSIFVQAEAGTAVCISPDGLLLTCSHCIAETAAEVDATQHFWLLFADGQAIMAKCVAWDGRRDLALLRIIAAQPSSRPSSSFPFCRIAELAPETLTRLICVGQPGADDLESLDPGRKTGYEVLHVSNGLYHGIAPDVTDPEDNSEIGALMHDCWTYWGHSGAPLLERRTGKLVGLHSSWDDRTAMRRGVPLVAIRSFLKEQGVPAD